MSFRKVGGLQYSATQNIVKNRYNTSDTLYVTQNVGQPNTYINFLSDISGNIIIYGDLDVSGNLHVAGNLDVSGNENIAGDLYVGGDLDVSGNENIAGDLYVGGNLDVSGNENISGDLYVSGNENISGDLYVAGNLDVSGNENITGNLYVKGDLDVSGNENITGDLHVKGDLDVSGNENISGDLYVAGNLDVSGNENISGDLYIVGNLDVTGNTTMANTLTMTSATAANRSINNTYYTLLDASSGNPGGVIYASSAGNFTYDNQTGNASHFLVSYDASANQNFVIRANYDGVVISAPNAATSSIPIFTIQDTNAINKSICFLPETAATGGSYNPITPAGTSLMYSTTISAADTTSLTIAPHSNTACGLVLNSTSVMLGCGGGTSVPTNRIDIDGSANTIALTSVNPPTSTTSVAIPFPDSSTKLATTEWVSTNFNSGSPSYNIIVIQDDFLTGLVSIVTWVNIQISGTGAVETSIVNHPGLYRIGISATTPSNSAITLNQSPITMTQLNYVEWIWRYNTSYTLRTIQVGVANSDTVFTTSAYWELTSTNSYEAFFNGVSTGFTVSATNLTGNLPGKWLYGKIEILSSTSIKYTLTNLTDNSTETYTHIGTVSANLVTPICKITQTATTIFSSADLDIDYCAFKYTTART